MSFLDKAIQLVSPSWALQRERDALKLDQFQKAKTRFYDAGGRGPRIDNWKTSQRDSNSELLPRLRLMRNRSRDLRRNNELATAATESIIDNMIGYGIRPQFKSTSKRINKVAAQLWRDHCETPQIDYEGRNNIYALQALWAGSTVESGEVILRRYWTNDKNSPLPFKIQTLEADFLDDTRDAVLQDGGRIIGGVEYGPDGKRRNYWLFPEHPGARVRQSASMSVPIPAEDICHIFRVDRPGQVRGVPWSAPVILRLHDFDEVQDAYVMREKIAACFSVFYTTDEDNDQLVEMQKELMTGIEPGMIAYPPPGASVEFANPPGVNGFRDFNWVGLHAIASGFQVPYEVFGDLSGVNFTSGRMGWQNYQRRVERWQWQMFIPHGCSTVADWFNEAAIVSMRYTEPCSFQWVPPRRMMVNPKEEVAAMKEEVRNGFATWPQQVTALGFDPDEQVIEIAASNKLLDENNVKLDCDPRFALPAGSAGATDPAKTPEPNPEGN